jgi:S1-C subfamily serine protease
MTFEELANLSESIVMIKVMDGEGKYYKSGSGVVISSDGYILTNCHVISGGTGFAVQFENDAQEYITTSVIKYHGDFDLAVIRVSRPCIRIPVFKGGTLVRGQRIVAIGSPLGLFNTISDGIISGFRQLDEVSMVQFTAPISHGSSGGALLDMHGRLVGIITAGFDSGQNLNLAVDYTTISGFAGNFIEG